MRALALVVRTELRYRGRSWLALALLVAVVGGVVLGAAAAGRRTASAFPRYERQYGIDAFVYTAQPVPALAALPEVASAVEDLGPANGTPTCACPHPLSPQNLGVMVPPSPLPKNLFKLMSGRLPNPAVPDEALASITFARDEGIHVGSTVRVPFYASSQAGVLLGDTSIGPPTGPTVTFRVVGIEAGETDFPSVGIGNYTLVADHAFARSYAPRIAYGYAYEIRLRHGLADITRFDHDAQDLGALGTTDVDQTAASIAAAIHPQAEGWWVLALLAGLAGVAVVGQALSRQANVEAEEYRTLAAIGMSADDLIALGLARALAIGVTGALGAVLVAFLLSPLAPVGEARAAEPSTGFAFDAFVLGLGALAIVVAVVLLAAWPTYRASRLMRNTQTTPPRPSMVVARLAGAGAPPSAVIGVRRALDRGRGRESVPVGSALGGAILAVAALCGTAVFGSSLTHLVATPPLYGQDFQMWFNGFSDVAQADAAQAQLVADKSIRAVTLGMQSPVEINGIPTHSIAGQAVRGRILISPASGRLPQRDGEVALGSKTLRQAKARVGSSVRLTFPLPSGGKRVVTARVVGTVSFPPDFGVVGLGTGAYMTINGLIDAQCAPGPEFAACRTAANQQPVLLSATVPGNAGRAAVTRYYEQYSGLVYRAVKPDDLVNFGQAVNFPLILGAVLMLFGLATLLHVLVVSVARRRRELGLLKAIGLVRHQIVAAVCWQATTVAVVGLVIGLPVGIIGGRAVWHAFAVNIGVVPVTVVEVASLLALGAGVLVIANVLAVGPALVSARARVGDLMRDE